MNIKYIIHKQSTHLANNIFNLFFSLSLFFFMFIYMNGPAYKHAHMCVYIYKLAFVKFLLKFIELNRNKFNFKLSKINRKMLKIIFY
jgi:hypothetical protein